MTKIIETKIIFTKIPNVFDLLKSCWLNFVPSLKNLRQVVPARNEQANLQPTLNKEEGVWVSQLFVTDGLQNLKKLKRVY